MPPLSPFWFFVHLCWRCSIRSTCSKISMSRLFLRSTSLALCQLVKDMKEVCKTHCHFKKRKHTHTHIFNCKQLRLDGRKWLTFPFQSNNSRQLLTFQRLRGSKTNSGPSKFTGCGARKGALGLHNDLIHFSLYNWPDPLQSTQLTWSTSLSGAHCSASCKSH